MTLDDSWIRAGLPVFAGKPKSTETQTARMLMILVKEGLDVATVPEYWEPLQTMSAATLAKEISGFASAPRKRSWSGGYQHQTPRLAHASAQGVIHRQK